MAETFSISEQVIPGTYIRVSAEALIGAAAVSTGNIGIVGTASRGQGETHLLSAFGEGRAAFGDYDAYDDGGGELNLSRAAELAYRNGAGVVFAHGLDPAHATPSDFTTAFEELAKDDVNILVAPELSTDDALSVLGSILEEAENNGKDMMAVIGTDASDVDAIKAQVPTNDRIVFVAPGIRAFDAASAEQINLPATYTAAAVAGLMSTLSVQSSPTNKTLPGAVHLAQRFSYGETKELVKNRVLVLEERAGVRVVRGLTTDDGAFTQITTRRITDYAKAGIRSASNPFIGRLNNSRVRKALRGSIDGFLTTMKVDEALVEYSVDVTASRDDEIHGRAIVNAVLQPVFTMDFVDVLLMLQ
jgi:hypothetical protein